MIVNNKVTFWKTRPMIMFLIHCVWILMANKYDLLNEKTMSY